ncbi:MAG: hypothetical protein SFW36_02865 [Leptolyngbyaceae cyanobacterium bins.59]|nr:hypothetical protein [Leptolyngbyaceae cyanobacterium bins.59]
MGDRAMQQSSNRFLSLWIQVVVGTLVTLQSMAMSAALPSSLAQPERAPKPVAPETLACPTDLPTLTSLLIRDLPSYANRVSQRARRRVKSPIPAVHVLLAGRPELVPLSLSTYSEGLKNTPEPLQQIFLTTLERQYTDRRVTDLQSYHWLFLTETPSGWRLAMMFSRLGHTTPNAPLSPPRDTSDGVIAQAVEEWLRDCRSGVIRS